MEPVLLPSYRVSVCGVCVRRGGIYYIILDLAVGAQLGARSQTLFELWEYFSEGEKCVRVCLLLVRPYLLPTYWTLVPPSWSADLENWDKVGWNLYFSSHPNLQLLLNSMTYELLVRSVKAKVDGLASSGPFSHFAYLMTSSPRKCRMQCPPQTQVAKWLFWDVTKQSRKAARERQAPNNSWSLLLVSPFSTPVCFNEEKSFLLRQDHQCLILPLCL